MWLLQGRKKEKTKSNYSITIKLTGKSQSDHRKLYTPIKGEVVFFKKAFMLSILLLVFSFIITNIIADKLTFFLQYDPLTWYISDEHHSCIIISSL